MLQIQNFLFFFYKRLKICRLTLYENNLTKEEKTPYLSGSPPPPDTWRSVTARENRERTENWNDKRTAGKAISVFELQRLACSSKGNLIKETTWETWILILVPGRSLGRSRRRCAKEGEPDATASVEKSDRSGIRSSWLWRVWELLFK